MNPEQAQALRAPFANDLIETRTIAGRSISYLNHAIVTDRLIQVDPNWSWEPMGINLDGTPVIDGVGGLWIRLTLCESTRIGYGASDAHQKGADAIKSAISDAIKNAAMRFGVALDLWAKEAPAETKPAPKATKELSTATQKMIERIGNAGSLIELTEVVPLIQGGAFTDAEKRNLRLIFDNKKVELGA